MLKDGEKLILESIFVVQTCAKDDCVVNRTYYFIHFIFFR